MCGIAGIIDQESFSKREDRVGKMLQHLIYRGPDAEGVWSSGAATLGHRRLSVIDLVSGQQPMVSGDGKVALTYNGEIYNFQELRESLEAQGCSFKTRSDTEVILQAYLVYGQQCLKHFRGMFSLAIWDDDKHELFCARDRFGKKPFYYFWDGKTFVFASGLESLFASGLFEKRIESRALYYYLTYGYIPHPLSIYQNIFKLAPGHSLLLKEDALHLRPYWEMETPAIFEKTSEEELIYLLQDRMESSVNLRLTSDVPLGAFLSGGVDSAVVAGMASRLREEPLHTFTIGFDAKEYNEIPKAAKTSRFFHTQHHSAIFEGDIPSVLETLMPQMGEPFADASIIPTYYVSKLAREKVTVALSGDGADELFGGYDRYVAGILSEQLRAWTFWLPASFWKKMKALPFSKKDQRHPLARLQRFLVPLGLPLEERYRSWITSGIFSENAGLQGDFAAIFSKELQDDFLFQNLKTHPEWDTLRRLSSWDIRQYLPCDLLFKTDIASMAHSLEVRSPFLDQHVASLAWALSSRMKIRGMKTKSFLKRAFGPILPWHVLSGKKKGFGVPLRQWFSGKLKPFAESVFLDEKAGIYEWIEPAFVQKIWKEHLSGRANHEKLLWSFLVLESWNQKCFKNSASRSPVGIS